MEKVNAVRMGVGAGFIMLGAYMAINFSSNIVVVVAGIIVGSIGISLAASS